MWAHREGGRGVGVRGAARRGGGGDNERAGRVGKGDSGVFASSAASPTVTWGTLP